MDKIYISPNIYYLNNNLFYQDDRRKIKITNNNWHRYLKEYGWEKLPICWRKRLNNKDRNFRYGILDCGSQGDCLFHCIAEALNNNYNIDSKKYDVEELRVLTANQITNDNYFIILENYKCEYDSNDFNGNWSPHLIKNIDELKKEIKKSGENFWGDHILLQLLQESLKFNVIVLNNEDIYNNIPCTIHPMACDLEKYDNTIILYYEDGLHFQLVGYYDDNKIITHFKNGDLPSKLLEIYNNDCNTF